MALSPTQLPLDRWIPLAEAARIAGEPPWKFRRKMLALNAQQGGGLLRHFGFGTRLRRLHVSAEALLSLLRTDPNAQDAELTSLAARVRDLEISLAAEKKARKALQSRFYALMGGPKNVT